MPDLKQHAMVSVCLAIPPFSQGSWSLWGHVALNDPHTYITSIHWIPLIHLYLSVQKHEWMKLHSRYAHDCISYNDSVSEKSAVHPCWIGLSSSPDYMTIFWINTPLLDKPGNIVEYRMFNAFQIPSISCYIIAFLFWLFSNQLETTTITSVSLPAGRATSTDSSRRCSRQRPSASVVMVAPLRW